MRITHLIIALIPVLSCKPQAQILQPNSYVTNEHLNKFVGTWRWVNGTDTLIVKLAKVRYYYIQPAQSSADKLVGCHKYISNGQVIESSLERYDSVVNINHRRNTFFAWNNESDTLKVEGVVKDISKRKNCKIFLDYTAGTTPQIVWKLEPTNGLAFTLPGQQPYDHNFTLPRNLIPTKQ
jgi:hypothetical protein